MSKKVQLNLTGLDCADCAAHFEHDITNLDGIIYAKVDFINSKLSIEYDDLKVNLQQITGVVNKAGYSIEQREGKRLSTLLVKGLDCPNESRLIAEHLNKMDGIHDLKFNLLAHKLIIEHSIPVEDIIVALNKPGFEARLADSIVEQPELSFWQRHKMLIFTTIAGIFAVSGTILHYFRIQELITTPLLLIAVITGGFHIGRKGFQEARNFRLGMNFLMSIAVLGAIVIGEWSEAAIVIFLFALAQLLESYSVDRARKSIQSLMELAPYIALVKTGAGEISLSVDDVAIGDIIIIKPGERIPLDAIVIAGRSHVNQAPITGESMPVAKVVNDEIYAGTINENGILEARVTKKSSDSTIARIIHKVEEAQAQKAPIQSFVEKFARYYTPVVVAAAVLFAILPSLLFNAEFTEWFYRALVLLVISCPCALVISTPVTIISGLTNAARNGILIKGGAYLENFSKLKVLAFDKTGTLTTGKPTVRDVIPVNYHSREDLLKIAVSIEAWSEHSLAKAILEYAYQQKVEPLPIGEFEAITGKGVRATIEDVTYLIGNHRLFEENGWCEDDIHHILDEIENRQHTAVIVGNSKSVLGVISVADAIRKDVVNAIKQLHEAGVQKTVMLTGDNEQTAAAIASEIGIDKYEAELLPEDKVTAIKRLISDYGQVAMVGDGINDAPALATATMGISMGETGTDAALETADIALMNDDLTRLSYLKRLSRKTVAIIKQNIFFAIFIRAVFVLLAIPGWATLWMAVFADMGASLVVVMNGLRALKMDR